MRKLSAVLAVALAFGLCTTPSALATGCDGDAGDPVYDPGGTNCYFGMAPAVPGAEARVQGKYYGRYPLVYESSYLKDTADDGLAAYLWVRTFVGETQAEEKWITRASGAGATTTVTNSWADSDSFELRVCVGEGTATCSGWRG